MTNENLKILLYPNPALRQITPPVTQFDDTLRQTIKQMFAIMYRDDGAGLAAPQLGLSLRLFVMDVSYQQNQPLCFINPEIIAKEGMIEREEGCLSFPGVYAKVPRALSVTLQYQDEYGKAHTLVADKNMAHCIQHELDHLNGILHIDYLSKLKQSRLLKKMGKLLREAN